MSISPSNLKDALENITQGFLYKNPDHAKADLDFLVQTLPYDRYLEIVCWLASSLQEDPVHYNNLVHYFLSTVSCHAYADDELAILYYLYWEFLSRIFDPSKAYALVQKVDKGDILEYIEEKYRPA